MTPWLWQMEDFGIMLIRFFIFVFQTIFSKHIETDKLVEELTNNGLNLFKLGYKESLKINFKCKICFNCRFLYTHWWSLCDQAFLFSCYISSFKLRKIYHFWSKSWNFDKLKICWTIDTTHLITPVLSDRSFKKEQIVNWRHLFLIHSNQGC